MMKRIVTILLAMVLILPAVVQAARQLPVVHVAIVADGSVTDGSSLLRNLNINNDS